MIHEIVMNEENLNKVIEDCKYYATNCYVSEDEKQEYLDDIEEHPNDWGIIGTGVFHDAIGKISDIVGKSIFVADEY